MIKVQTINKYPAEWEDALADRIARMVREDFGVSVIVTVEGPLPLDPTPYLLGWGARRTRKTDTFAPRPQFEQNQELYK